MISRNLFILEHQIGGRDFYPVYKRLVQNQWNSREEIKEEQEKRLRNMINFAYENVPYYHKLFDDFKLSLFDVSGATN